MEPTGSASTPWTAGFCSANWNTYKDNYVNNPIAADRLRYDVLYHTDLSRTRGQSNGLDLDRLNWGNYDLVVIDESHNFRNGTGGAGTHKGQGENRYEILMRKVIRAGVKTKVLMLSATPVNNRFYDLRNQLALAYEGNADTIDAQLNTTKPIDEVFRQAQIAFSTWSKLPAEKRTTAALLKKLDFDFFEILDPDYGKPITGRSLGNACQREEVLERIACFQDVLQNGSLATQIILYENERERIREFEKRMEGYPTGEDHRAAPVSDTGGSAQGRAGIPRVVQRQEDKRGHVLRRIPEPASDAMRERHPL